MGLLACALSLLAASLVSGAAGVVASEDSVSLVQLRLDGPVPRNLDGETDLDFDNKRVTTQLIDYLRQARKDIKVMEDLNLPPPFTAFTSGEIQTINEFIVEVGTWQREAQYQRDGVKFFHMKPHKPRMTQIKRILQKLSRHLYAEEFAHVVAENKAYCFHGYEFQVAKVLEKLQRSPDRYFFEKARVHKGKCEESGYSEPAEDKKAQKCFHKVQLFLDSKKEHRQRYVSFQEDALALYTKKQHKSLEEAQEAWHNICDKK